MRSSLALVALLLTVAVAGCGASSPTSASNRAASRSGSGSGPAALVGSGCGFIPSRGPGSLRSMSTQSVVDAVASNPQLSVFSSQIKTAALDERLSARKTFTLFIPVNSAYSALTSAQITQLRKPANLPQFVLGQVVASAITPARIARGGTAGTQSGREVTLAKRGPQYQVNAATVVCGNIKTANATIYVIDRVLLPPK
jgi:uncharacterized surface protein with fasciclin (FAS1) repeats